MAIGLKTLPAVTVASGGTAVKLTANETWVTSVTIQAEFTNVSKICLGDSTVTTSTGIQIPIGDCATIDAPQGPRGGAEEFDLSKIYINSSTTGDGVRIIAFGRTP